jgi:hypothetical protein
MSVFDLEKIKEELSVHDPLMPCVFKALRIIARLCEEGQKLEAQRNWLAFQQAKACLDAANDACVWNTGDCPICPLDTGGRCLEVTSKTFIEAAEKATKEAGK